MPHRVCHLAPGVAGLFAVAALLLVGADLLRHRRRGSPLKRRLVDAGLFAGDHAYVSTTGSPDSRQHLSLSRVCGRPPRALSEIEMPASCALENNPPLAFGPCPEERAEDAGLPADRQEKHPDGAHTAANPLPCCAERRSRSDGPAETRRY